MQKRTIHTHTQTYTHARARTRPHTHIDVCMLRRHGRTATRSRSHSTASAAKVPEWRHAPYRAWPARCPALKPDCHLPAALALAHGHFRRSPVARVRWASQLVADARPAPALCMRRRAVGRNTTVGGFRRVCLCVKVHRGAVPRAGPQPRVCIRRLLQGTTDPAQPPRAAELGSPTGSERRPVR